MNTRYYFLRNSVIEKVLRLTQRKEKYLVVSAIRFIRTVIGRNDETLNRHIVNHNLLQPIIQAFIANGTRYNLLNSAVLELIEYIRKENIKCLVEYLVKKHYEQVVHLDCVGTFQALKLRYEQNLEGCLARVSTVASAPSHSNQMASVANNRKRLDERALEKEEEDYFNEDSDDEDDTATARIGCSPSDVGHAAGVNGTVFSRSGSVALVDYEDEDDDIPVPTSASKENSEVSNRSMSQPSADGSDSVGSDASSSKRKSVPDDLTEGETTCVKQRRVSGNLKGQSSGGNTYSQHLKQMENHSSESMDKRDIRSSRGDDVSVHASKNDIKSTVVTDADSNGHEIENCARPLNSDDDVGANLRGALESKTSERIGSPSTEVMRPGPPSPETFIVG
eukprot:TRINITY_DN717_c0_g1_i3.p1 TRINITY_DN717_c0_g1~~TRINITY_DN717_c0_g1_i3.p1  ORF type:complete len:393 (-),score=76.78 TRINITY_DN717_c0_g1_i3:347-1525(-)